MECCWLLKRQNTNLNEFAVETFCMLLPECSSLLTCLSVQPFSLYLFVHSHTGARSILGFGISISRRSQQRFHFSAKRVSLRVIQNHIWKTAFDVYHNVKDGRGKIIPSPTVRTDFFPRKTLHYATFTVFHIFTPHASIFYV